MRVTPPHRPPLQALVRAYPCRERRNPWPAATGLGGRAALAVRSRYVHITVSEWRAPAVRPPSGGRLLSACPNGASGPVRRTDVTAPAPLHVSPRTPCSPGTPMPSGETRCARVDALVQRVNGGRRRQSATRAVARRRPCPRARERPPSRTRRTAAARCARHGGTGRACPACRDSGGRSRDRVT